MHAVRAGLKAATDSAHLRVETALGLLDVALSADRLADAVARLYGFWLPAETAANAWAARSPELAARLDWPRRRRLPLIQADLVALDTRPESVTAHPPVPLASDADLLGWLYVAEGATLGGAVIERKLAASGAAAPRAFTPYPEGPGPMWRGYLNILDGWAGADDLRRAAVIGAATHYFTELAEWFDAARAEAMA